MSGIMDAVDVMKRAEQVIDALCRNNAALLAKLEELYDWLDDIGDGAPDASPIQHRAMNEANEIRRLIQRTKP